MELYRMFPEMCLVRSPAKAYLPDGDGELRSLHRTRTLHVFVPFLATLLPCPSRISAPLFRSAKGGLFDVRPNLGPLERLDRTGCESKPDSSTFT